MVEMCVVSVAGGLGDRARQRRTLILTVFTLGHGGLLPSIGATRVRQAWKRREDTSLAAADNGKPW